jgi:hypothetical protein
MPLKYEKVMESNNFESIADASVFWHQKLRIVIENWWYSCCYQNAKSIQGLVQDKEL